MSHCGALLSLLDHRPSVKYDIRSINRTSERLKQGEREELKGKEQG